MNKMRVIKIERKRLHDQQKEENKFKSVFKISKCYCLVFTDSNKRWEGWIEGWIGRWIGRWIEGWIEGWMNGWMGRYELMNDFPMHISVHMNSNLWVVFYIQISEFLNRLNSIYNSLLAIRDMYCIFYKKKSKNWP